MSLTLNAADGAGQEVWWTRQTEEAAAVEVWNIYYNYHRADPAVGAPHPHDYTRAVRVG